MRLQKTIRNSLCLTLVALFSAAVVASESIRLEEMLVTSERYQSPLQGVPVSVHIVTGEHIDQAGVSNLSDLSASIPNLVIAEGAISTNVYMRGVGTGTNRMFEQSVGMFVDEVYMGRGNQYRASFVDLQQVEVLRGPQGALFGKNTMAGAVVLTTRKPELEEDFNASLGLEWEPQYGGRNATAVLSGALSDEWAARLVHKESRHDGYWHNTFNGSDETAVDESISRLSLLYKPTDEWRFNAKLEHLGSDKRGSNAQLRALEPLTPLSALLQSQMFLADPALETELDHNTSLDTNGLSDLRELNSDNAVVSTHFDGNNFSASYTLGYSAFVAEDSQDLDFSPLDFIAVFDERDYTQWSQELRFDHQLSNTSRLQWGLYWQDQSLDVTLYEHLALPPPRPFWEQVFLGAGINPTILPPTSFTRATHADQQSDSWAAFAEWDWEFSDDWRLLIGGRYNREQKEYQRISSEDEYLNVGTPASLAASVTAQIFDVHVLSPEFSGKRVETDFLPSAKLWWDMNESTNVYAKIERGAKSGGFNAVADAAPGDQEFDDEQAINYEIGTKGLYFDGSVALNASVFYTEIEDLQVTVLNGSRFLVGNVAASVSQGAELDGRWRIDNNWQISGYGSYLDTHYKNYKTGPCTARKAVAGASVCDLSGETVLFAPEWSAGLQIDYERELFRNIDLIAGVGINYSDDYSANADLDPIDHQSSYTKYDVQIGLRSEHWDMTLVGKNLSDETIVNYSVDTPLIVGGHAAYLAAPRTYMVRLQLRY